MSELAVDTRIVPWSFRGSYLSLSTLAGNGGRLSPNVDINLVTHQIPSGRPLFDLRPSPVPLGAPNGFHKSPSPTTFSATPSCLKWSLDGETVVEATFQDVATLRLRGSIPLNMDTDADVTGGGYLSYIFPLQSRVSRPPTIEYTTRGYQGAYLVALKGEFETINDCGAENGNRRVTIHGTGNDPGWEMILIERAAPVSASKVQSPPAPISMPAVISALAKVTFDQARASMSAVCDRHATDLCPWSSGHPTPTERYACYIMWTSTVRAMAFMTREATLMSKLWMNKVWSWDNCFNALALAAADSSTALDQLLLPYDFQTPEGRLPDSITNVEASCSLAELFSRQLDRRMSTLVCRLRLIFCPFQVLYDFVKPPIYGWTVLKMLENVKLSDGAMSEIYTKVTHLLCLLKPDCLITDRLLQVARFTDFWLETRTTAHSSLPYYSHGNDSGWDNATCFDGDPMIVAPDLAALLVIQADMLSKVAAQLGNTAAKEHWAITRDRVREDLVSELWVKDQFVVKRARTGETLHSSTLLTLVPLVAASYLPKDVVASMVKHLERFLTPYGLATEDPESRHYEPDGYWRGPIWAPPTLLIESGLRGAGHVEMADRIRDRYMSLCDKAGFAENYDAFEGTGNRDLSYTWAASVYLVMAREKAREKARG